ncbi:hypothetical protein [Actinomarinicola tropica]|uniref:Uncharacterized protein n=1 Tax=Actinomarinicola tropica TaxID=2789776 RepID=A0A5Q2RN82_9ACTN|nr:hypothetical protein [Actinomarinicola tropica]QGG95866.1 hypothetical protein GH723_12580 [Actinomarinicola tropica]
MSATRPPLADATLQIRPWADPVIDEMGHDLRSHYVERFWLGILGPSTTLLLRRIALGFDAEPDGFTLHLGDTARSLGLGARAGKHSPFVRALDRCCQFGAARRHGDQLDVRRRLPPLTRFHVSRLPEPLQAEHDDWVARSSATPTPADAHRRARRLALGLLELGEDHDEVERQLHLWRVHPAMAHEALRWATAHLAHDAA